jgi:SAM-dependent methyltransferase
VLFGCGPRDDARTDAAPTASCDRGRPGCPCDEHWGTDTAHECDPGATCYFGYCWADDALPTDSYLYTARYAEDPVLIKRALTAWLHVAPGDRAADLGAGHGGLTFQISQRVGPSGHVYATDISRSAVDVIAGHAARQHITNIETRLALHRRDPALAGVAKGELSLVLMVNSVQFRGEYPRPTEVAYLASIAALLRDDGELLYHQDWLWPGQLDRDALVALFAEARLRLTSELPLPDHIPPSALVHYPDGSQPDATVRRGFTLVFGRDGP